VLRLAAVEEGALRYALVLDPDVDQAAAMLTDAPIALCHAATSLRNLVPISPLPAASEAVAQLVVAALGDATLAHAMERLAIVAASAACNQVVLTIPDVARCAITDRDITAPDLVGSLASRLADEVDGYFEGELLLSGEMLRGVVQYRRGAPSDVTDMAVGRIERAGNAVDVLVVWQSARPAPVEGDTSRRVVTGTVMSFLNARVQPASAVRAGARAAQAVLHVQAETVSE
jgi:hypothetical protein